MREGNLRRAAAQRPPAVAAAVAPLGALSVPWGLAGGWALDLAIGRTTRAHADVDLMMFRADQAALREAFPAWSFEILVERRRQPWPRGLWLELPVHQIQARPPHDGTPELEFLLNERDGDDWLFRRDPAVRLPLWRALVTTSVGLRALAPEIVLLYKAKESRPKDEADFCSALPCLGEASRSWLASALDRRHPGHPWRLALGREPT